MAHLEKKDSPRKAMARDTSKGNVNDGMMSWLATERQLEKEWRKLQEESFVVMLKRNQRIGQGNKESDRLTVGPYHDSRVRLSRLESLSELDDPTFINASYITMDYIAAAMPYNEATERDFWRMTLEHKVPVVVMLNRPGEQAKKPYWPKECDSPVTYGGLVTVTMLEQTYRRDISSYVRKFRVDMKVTSMRASVGGDEDENDGRKRSNSAPSRKRGVDEELLIGKRRKNGGNPARRQASDSACDLSEEEEEEVPVASEDDGSVSHVVCHLQYDDWDDMRIPDDKEVFVQFMDFVSKQDEELGHTGPIVAHCFGGAGRTGTFLTIHITLKQMKRFGGKAINVLDLLALMRNERAFLVQTPEQYKFCYRIILEFYENRRQFRQGVLDDLLRQDFQLKATAKKTPSMVRADSPLSQSTS